MRSCLQKMVSERSGLGVMSLGGRSFPHLINFKSGQSVLLTVPGRKPYCLKCQSVGHIRSRCPGRSFAAAVRTPERATADAVAWPDAPSPQPGLHSGNDISDPDGAPAPVDVGSGEPAPTDVGSEEVGAFGTGRRNN